MYERGARQDATGAEDVNGLGSEDANEGDAVR